MRRLVRHGIVAASLCGMAIGTAVAVLPGGASTVEAVPILTAPVAAPLPAEAPRTTRADRDVVRPQLDRNAVANRADALIKDQKSIATASSKAKKAARKAAREKAEQERADAEKARKKAEEEAAQAKIPYVSGSSSPREIGKKVLADKGYDASDFTCFDNIIKRESMWDINATNRSSGAYGIPQALPGSKMASAGSDWRTNPATQVKWALGYMESRYGGVCSAWSFKRSHGWY